MIFFLLFSKHPKEEGHAGLYKKTDIAVRMRTPAASLNREKNMKKKDWF